MDDAGQILETITIVTDDADEDRPPPDPNIHHDGNREPRHDQHTGQGRGAPGNRYRKTQDAIDSVILL